MRQPLLTGLLLGASLSLAGHLAFAQSTSPQSDPATAARGIEKKDIHRGMVIAKPGSVANSAVNPNGNGVSPNSPVSDQQRLVFRPTNKTTRPSYKTTDSTQRLTIKEGPLPPPRNEPPLMPNEPPKPVPIGTPQLTPGLQHPNDPEQAGPMHPQDPLPPQPRAQPIPAETPLPRHLPRDPGIGNGEMPANPVGQAGQAGQAPALRPPYNSTPNIKCPPGMELVPVNPPHPYPKHCVRKPIPSD